jgi:class 3 adenylate cyclase/tetratricopeptide (TPR) repeat protein
MQRVERKLATVLFVDIVDSTELVADTDPEVVRRRVGRFFDQVSHCIVTHGGTVEKFAGDAVMAAFGVPLAHEDDAERAVRAALATMERVKELELRARVGIESGEVVADDSESTFATGEAVNLAARLQQSASADEILVGPNAARLVRGRVELEPLAEPLQLRGWARPIAASRVVCAVEQGAPVHSVAAPLVGRGAELELLENTYARTARDRRASLVTVYGEPGVGKSRLVREFLDGLEGATVLKGRSLPYGEGVTWWPIAEMVKASAGISDDDPLDRAYKKLKETCEDEAVADLLGLAVGVLEAVEAERSQQEIAWAVRALVEQLAEAQPLVLVFEDVHWGEEPLLDLIEHLAAWVREAPLLLLCLARPELLDVRPTWGGGRIRALTLELEPLPLDESAELIDLLIGEHDLPVDVDTVLAKTEGNPLFVEETIRMLVERSGGGVERIPDTLQALIAARIDRLAPAQRRMLQRASVMGRIFMRGAIEQLTPENDVSATLDQLLLRDFVVREPRATISGEEAFKFKHVLIREVAYAGLSKGSRADLHQAFAGWLGERAGDELLEIRAFHLDQAAHLLAELDGETPPELSEEAAIELTKAGRRALSRESFRSGRKLLVRANELAPTLERRYLAARAAWRLADFAVVHVEMELVRAEAEATGDRSTEGRALTGLAEVALNLRADAPGALALVERALTLLEAEGGVPLFDALWARMHVTGWLGDNDDFRSTAKRAIAVAQDLGREDLEALVTQALAQSYLLELEAEHAEPLVQRALDLADGSGSVVGRALALQSAGHLASIRGDNVAAVERYTEARSMFEEIGATSLDATLKVHLGRTFLEMGELDQAEPPLRDAVRVLKGIGDRAHLCEAQRLLAQLLVRRGKLDEAERLALESRETVGPEDRQSVSTTRFALGLVRLAQGRDAEADELFADSLDGLRQYGIRSVERDAIVELAELMRSRGRDADAARYVERLGELSPRSTAPIA